MKNAFPAMFDRPETSSIIASAVYWTVCYIGIPFITTVMLIGSYSDGGMVAAFDIGYFVLNFFVMAGCFGVYMKDSFMTVQINPGKFGKVVLICGILAGAYAVITMAIGWGFGLMGMVSYFPVTETSVLTVPAYMVMRHPVAGMLTAVLLCPITVSCMFYATVFAPACVNIGKWAYLIMALLLALPRIFNIWWLGYLDHEIMTYLVQLPIHMLACWTYQKTDTVWAPIATLSLGNLISGGILLAMYMNGFLYLNY